MKYRKGFDHKKCVSVRCCMMKCPFKDKAAKLGTSLFLVRKDRLEQWVELSGNAELLELPLDHLRNNMRFCEQHFPGERIRRNDVRKTLVKDADPAIFPDGHTPLSKDAIEAWKRSKHFGVNHPKPSVNKPGPSKENCPPAFLQDSTGSLPDSPLFPQDITVPQNVPSNDSVPLGVQGQISSTSVASETCVQIPSAPATSTPFSSGNLLILPVRNDNGETSLEPLLCVAGSAGEKEVSRQSVLHQEVQVTPCSSKSSNVKEVLAQPLPDESPKTTKRTRDSTFCLRKRARPSGASQRTTVRKVMDESVGTGVVLTPNKTVLCKKMRNMIQRLEQLQKENNHLRALVENKNLESILSHLASPTLRQLVLSNIRNQSRSTHGRRYQPEELLTALSIFKRSPKAYRYLCFLFVLPSVRTLQRLLQKLPMTPGINRPIMKHLAKRINNSPKDKCVILMFDEMFIKKRFVYNENSGLIEGFVDFGLRKGADGKLYHDRRPAAAEHALVFQIQGLAKKYKQPVGYHFVSGTVSSKDLQELIKEYIQVLQENGFVVIATVCDQGATNQGALKMLQTATDDGAGLKEGYFKVGGVPIFPLFDVPHLFKSLRNNFMSARYIVWDNTIAKFADICKAIAFDENLFKLKQLTLEQIRPEGKKKMKVKWAMKTLSSSTAAFLSSISTIARTGNLRRMYNFEGTALVVKDFDKLCDFTNGPAGPHDIKRKLRENVSARTQHLQVWQDFIKKMDEMEIHVYSKKTKKVVIRRPPCQDGWILTMKNMGRIWEKLRDEFQFNYLNLRQLNQDPLENLFGVIRQHGVTSDNPTCGHFSAALKSSIITRLTSYKSQGGNTESDSSELLYDLSDMLKGLDPEGEVDLGGDVSSADGFLFYEDADDLNSESRLLLEKLLKSKEGESEVTGEDVAEDLKQLESILSQGPAHVAGYIGQKIRKTWTCEACMACLTADVMEERHTFTHLKEYNPEKPALFYASSGFSRLVQTATETFQKNTKDRLHMPNIKSFVNNDLLMSSEYTWFSCPKADHFVTVAKRLNEILSRMLLHTLCRRKNDTIKLDEEAKKLAREAEKAKAKKKREDEKAERLAKREAGLKILAELRAKREALAVKPSQSQVVPPRKLNRSELILARANNIWNRTKFSHDP